MTQTQLDDLIATLERCRPLLPAIDAAGAEIRRALRNGHKLLTAGNGGSAADSLHLSEELVGRFEKDRPSLPAIALCADPALLTCIGNDFGFDQIFSRQIEGLGRRGDVLVIFSTSGRSTNVLAALRAAKKRKLRTIAVLGKNGGAARGLADHELIVPSDVTARIQEVHTFILHAWLQVIETDHRKPSRHSRK